MRSAFAHDRSERRDTRGSRQERDASPSGRPGQRAEGRDPEADTRAGGSEDESHLAVDPADAGLPLEASRCQQTGEPRGRREDPVELFRCGAGRMLFHRECDERRQEREVQFRSSSSVDRPRNPLFVHVPYPPATRTVERPRADDQECREEQQQRVRLGSDTDGRVRHPRPGAAAAGRPPGPRPRGCGSADGPRRKRCGGSTARRPAQLGHRRAMRLGLHPGGEVGRDGRGACAPTDGPAPACRPCRSPPPARRRGTRHLSGDARGGGSSRSPGPATCPGRSAAAARAGRGRPQARRRRPRSRRTRRRRRSARGKRTCSLNRKAAKSASAGSVTTKGSPMPARATPSIRRRFTEGPDAEGEHARVPQVLADVAEDPPLPSRRSRP